MDTLYSMLEYSVIDTYVYPMARYLPAEKKKYYLLILVMVVVPRLFNMLISGIIPGFTGYSEYYHENIPI